MIPGMVLMPVQEVRCLRGMLSLTSKGHRPDQHVNRALIREEPPEERERQSLRWSLGLLTIPLTPI